MIDEVTALPMHNDKEEDFLLQGYLDFIYNVLHEFKNKAVFFAKEKEEFVKQLINSFLFAKKGPKCKFKNSRKKAF